MTEKAKVVVPGAGTNNTEEVLEFDGPLSVSVHEGQLILRSDGEVVASFPPGGWRRFLREKTEE